MGVKHPGALCDNLLKVAGVRSFCRCRLFTPVYSNYVKAHALNLRFCLHSQVHIFYIEMQQSGEGSEAQKAPSENGA